MNEFYIGIVVGWTQTVFGHPFDTLKTIFQQGNKYNKQYLNPVRLYKGFKYPLLGNGLINGIVFQSEHLIYSNIYNHFLSGFFTGIIATPFINPIEYYKVRAQLKLPLQHQLYRGISATLCKEMFSCSFYFGTYFYLRDKTNSFIAGSSAGIVSWTFTYPLDIIKTKLQSNNKMTWKIIINKKNLWKGLSFCLIRSVVVNGISFTIYDAINTNTFFNTK